MSHHCQHEHEHDHVESTETNAGQSLYSAIDTSKVKCLNVVPKGAVTICEAFLKDQESKYNCSKFIQSDADCQMIIHVPFTGNCRILSLILRTNADDPDSELNTPKTLKIYKNFKKNLDFDTLSHATENFKIECPRDVGLREQHSTDATDNDDHFTFVEHQLPRNLFQDCTTLTLFFSDNWCQDEDLLSRVYYLEIRGELTGKLNSDNAVPLMTVYESAPNPVDHQKLENNSTDINLGM